MTCSGLKPTSFSRLAVLESNASRGTRPTSSLYPISTAPPVARLSISPREFYAAMRTGPALPRTSQPSPGDFRRLFQLLLTLHEQVIDVSLSRKLSGTMQSAEGAAARSDPQRVTVFDSEQVAAGQGLMVIGAGEAAQTGMGATRRVEGREQRRGRTSVARACVGRRLFSLTSRCRTSPQHCG